MTPISRLTGQVGAPPPGTRVVAGRLFSAGSWHLGSFPLGLGLGLGHFCPPVSVSLGQWGAVMCLVSQKPPYLRAPGAN